MSTSHRARRRVAYVAFVVALVATLVGAPSASAAWSPAGTVIGGVSGANGIDVDPTTGDVWIVSSFTNEVWHFSADGAFLGIIGGFGTGDGQFNLPSAVAVDSNGDVYVTDVGGQRAERFHADGTFVRSYGTGLLGNARGIDIDAAGNVYVADIATGLRKFASDGTLLTTYPASTASQPFAVSIDPDGYVWTTNFSDMTVRKIDPSTGAVLFTIGGFGQPTDIEFDSVGQAHVLNFNTGEIWTYTLAGAFVDSWPATAPFASIQIAVDTLGRLLISGGSEVIATIPPPTLVTGYLGPDGVATIDPAFAAATASQTKQLIDFDGDGFDSLAPHTFTPIPSATYHAALGVTLLNLDARSVGAQPWSHSPPIGAWQTNFSQTPAPTYSFVFDDPVASFDMFANVVQADMTFVVHLTNGLSDLFYRPYTDGSANITRFIGFAAASNVITRVDVHAFNHHIIDDVQFGRVANAPDAVDDTVTMAQGASVTVPVLDNDSDADTDPLTVTGVGGAGVGETLTTDGTGVTFTPPLGFCGPRQVSYTIDDGTGRTDTASIFVTVSCADVDGDGVDDAIGTGAGTFNDPISGGPTTSGTVTSIPAGFVVLVEDAVDPDGVRIRVVGSGAGQAVFSMCGGYVLKLNAGADVVGTCGSVKVAVAHGTATIVLSNDTTVTITSGVTAKVSGGSGGTFQLSDVSGGSVSVTTEGVTRSVTGDTTLEAWDFIGFSSPVDNGGVRNQMKAGRAVALKWRVVDAVGQPVTNVSTATVRVTSLPCSLNATVDQIEEIAAGGSGLQNLGNGYYQFNWQTPSSYAGSCKTMKLDLGEGITRDALFQFTR